MKVLAFSRVKMSSSVRLRFLCLKPVVEIKNLRFILDSIPYPCFDIDSVARLFSPSDIYFIDYTPKDKILPSYLNNIYLCENNPRISVYDSTTSLNKCLNIIHEYCPSIINSYNINLGNYFTLSCVSDKSKMGWVYYNGVPLFFWKPYNNCMVDVCKDISFNENGLVYLKENCMYLLTDSNVRHKPFTTGERLTVNLKSREISRVIQGINSNSYYSMQIQIFDMQMRNWVTIKTSEPILVLGKKGG